MVQCIVLLNGVSPSASLSLVSALYNFRERVGPRPYIPVYFNIHVFKT